jgi:hypothetical protein
MKKNYQKLIWLCFLPLLFLAACDGNANEPAAQPGAIQEIAPVEGAVPTVESDGVPVAIKPQLIEFYADW